MPSLEGHMLKLKLEELLKPFMIFRLILHTKEIFKQ
jgi:hypothetical protein